MLRLKGYTQNYHWGAEGESGQVASLLMANGDNIEQKQKYAELWMGTHVSGPAKLKRQKSHTLQDWLEENQVKLGLCQLPYLFKVLSVQKALSIQSHPNKQQAERLHKKFPQLYKDDNHKPEMAIAITNFRALCSFQPVEAIQQLPDRFPELQACVKDLQLLRNVQNGDTKYLKLCFSQLMHAKQQEIVQTVKAIISRIEERRRSGLSVSKKEILMQSLQKQFPYDVGILVAPFLNLVELKPGQGIYLEANQPHAYISGDCIECMATSDNVIRAGLTPKHIDKEGLIDTLSYTLEKPTILGGDSINQYTKLYQPPFDEFEVHKLDLPPNTSEKIMQLKSPQIWLVFNGSATVDCHNNKDLQIKELEYNLNLQRGEVLFVPSNAKISLKSGAEGISIWGASINQKALNTPTQSSHLGFKASQQSSQNSQSYKKQKKSIQRSSTNDSVHVMA